MDAGVLLREARARGRVTQRELAARAGTGQAAISDIERGALAPSLARLEELISLTGHQLSLAVVERPVLVDRELLADDLRMFAEERMELAALLSRRAFELAQAHRAGWVAAIVDDEP